MGYTRPTNARISSSWANHKTRKPPSREPGTDYACAYGTRLVAAGAGRVVDIKTTNSGEMGRYVTIDLDDGRRVRYLHLSVVGVSVGTRVKAGSYIGKSGGSANGNNWGVGAHVHVTLWARHAYSFGSNATLDFERYVGGSSGGNVSQDTKNRQAWLNKSRNAKLVVDGIEGPATIQAYKNYQTFLKQNYGYKDAVDGKWGANTQAAHQKYYDAWHKPKPTHTGNIALKQRQLNFLGYPVGEADGQAGPLFTSGTLNFQKENGLTADSINGDGTGAKLTELVKWVQTRLTANGFSVGSYGADGDPGNETINATKAFQKARNLTVDGIAGGATRGELLKTSTPTPTVAGRNATSRPTKDIQQFLISKGYNLGPYGADNEWGDWSTSATQQFQKDNGLEADGIWGEQTDKKAFGTTAPPTPVVQPAKARTPWLPFAKEGWDSPKGRGKRTGVTKITHFFFHHTGNTADQLAFFKGNNDGSMCTWYNRPNGDIFEVMNPENLPKATYLQNNWSFAMEIQNTSGEPTWGVSAASVESAAKTLAWLYSMKGKKLGAFTIDIELNRERVLGHKEAPDNATICPGPSLYPQIDNIIERAKAIYEAEYAPVKPVDPPVDPETPVGPEQPPVDPTEPGIPEGYTLVKTTTLTNIQTHLNALQIVVDNLLGGK